MASKGSSCFTVPLLIPLPSHPSSSKLSYLCTAVHRASGASDKPYSQQDAVPFKSPPSMEVEVQLPNQGPVKGLGIKPGLTLIVGGGFHGKLNLPSEQLSAANYCSYN